MSTTFDWSSTGYKRYKHDCNSCIFLGNWKEYDLYIHIRENVKSSDLITRDGDEGSYCCQPLHYMSKVDLSDPQPYDLRNIELVRRAREQGLI